MKRDSFIFYRSFYEAIKDLGSDIQGEIYTAIMEYSLYGKEIELKPIARSIFTLIKPQLDANNKRFDNGKKGGRPSKKETEEKPKQNQNKTKTKPNVNVNDNVNDNVNERESNALDFLKKNYAIEFQQDFEIKYSKKIKNLKKFEGDFNAKVELEGLKWTPRKLFARLGTFARNWIENQDKYGKSDNQTRANANAKISGRQAILNGDIEYSEFTEDY